MSQEEGIGSCAHKRRALNPRLSLLRELSHVPQGLTEIADAKQVRKTNQSGILYQFKKRFIYSVFTKDTLDEKGQARDTRVHVTL